MVLLDVESGISGLPNHSDAAQSIAMDAPFHVVTVLSETERFFEHVECLLRLAATGPIDVTSKHCEGLARWLSEER